MPFGAASGPTPPVEPLGVVSLTNATNYAVHPSPNPHNRMHYGLLREDRTLLESTVEDRHHGEHTLIPPDPPASTGSIRSPANRYTQARYTTSTVISSSRAASGSGGPPTIQTCPSSGRLTTERRPSSTAGSKTSWRSSASAMRSSSSRGPRASTACTYRTRATNTPTGAIRNTSPSWPPTTVLPRSTARSCGSPETRLTGGV
jgi:hypothetical protein